MITVNEWPCWRPRTIPTQSWCAQGDFVWPIRIFLKLYFPPLIFKFYGKRDISATNIIYWRYTYYSSIVWFFFHFCWRFLLIAREFSVCDEDIAFVAWASVLSGPLWNSGVETNQFTGQHQRANWSVSATPKSGPFSMPIYFSCDSICCVKWKMGIQLFRNKKTYNTGGPQCCDCGQDSNAWTPERKSSSGGVITI